MDPKGDLPVIKVKTTSNTHGVLSFEGGYVEEVEEREDSVQPQDGNSAAPEAMPAPQHLLKKIVKKGAIVTTEGAPAKGKRKTGRTGVCDEQEIAERIPKFVATIKDRHKAHVPAEKKRKTDKTDVLSEQEIEEKIKELTKSIATLYRHTYALAKKRRKMGKTGEGLTRSVAPADSSTKKKRTLPSLLHNARVWLNQRLVMDGARKKWFEGLPMTRLKSRR